MNNDISSVLDRSDKIRRSECVINYNRETVLMRKLSDRIDIRDITVRIAQSLKIDGSCILFDSALYFGEIMGIDECRLDSILGECVAKKVE